MSDGGHKQRPLLVWADIDEGIYEMVADLNTMSGVRTHASCQGTLDEVPLGPAPYGPQVMVSWATPEARSLIAAKYRIEEIDRDHGTPTNGSWGYAYPENLNA
jgi:hypothetical protein